jgi:hypothetical protein
LAEIKWTRKKCRKNERLFNFLLINVCQREQEGMPLEAGTSEFRAHISISLTRAGVGLNEAGSGRARAFEVLVLI